MINVSLVLLAVGRRRVQRLLDRDRLGPVDYHERRSTHARTIIVHHWLRLGWDSLLRLGELKLNSRPGTKVSVAESLGRWMGESFVFFWDKTEERGSFLGQSQDGRFVICLCDCDK